jgi:hypothetical protein
VTLFDERVAIVKVVMFLTRQLSTTDVKVTARLELTSSQAVALFKVSILRNPGNGRLDWGRVCINMIAWTWFSYTSYILSPIENLGGFLMTAQLTHYNGNPVGSQVFRQSYDFPLFQSRERQPNVGRTTMKFIRHSKAVLVKTSSKPSRVGRHKISDINLIYDTLKLSKLIADTLKIFSVPFIKQWRNLWSMWKKNYPKSLSCSASNTQLGTTLKKSQPGMDPSPQKNFLLG